MLQRHSGNERCGKDLPYNKQNLFQLRLRQGDFEAFLLDSLNARFELSQFIGIVFKQIVSLSGARGWGNCVGRRPNSAHFAKKTKRLDLDDGAVIEDC